MMKQKTILITGATGFLGGYLTKELAAAGFRLKLLVRNTPDVPAKERFSDVFPPGAAVESVSGTLPDCIEIIDGDISEEYLGLDTKSYLRLSDTVDEVFHCAAATKFRDVSGNTLMHTNVLGTEHVASFCLSGKGKRLHYVSTAYVSGTRRDMVFEHELEKGQSFNNNYEQSKFDAERLLHHFIKKYNIPTTIYRPSIIVGDSKTGFTKNYDSIYVFGRGLIRLKNYEMGNSVRKEGVCHSPSLRISGDKYGTINLVPVDYVARAIVAISLQEKSINKTFHIVNPSPPTVGELAVWMMAATGFHRVRIVPTYEFQIHPHMVQEKLFLQKTEAFLPYLFGEPYFDSYNTSSLLSGTGIECPMLTEDMMNMLIQFSLDMNWGRKGHTTVVCRGSDTQEQ